MVTGPLAPLPDAPTGVFQLELAIGPDGATAWSAGKQAFVKTTKGEERTHEAAPQLSSTLRHGQAASRT